MSSMFDGGPFDVNTFEETERERVQAQNAALRERDQRHEEQRRAQVVQEPEPPERPWWRR